MKMRRRRAPRLTRSGLWLLTFATLAGCNTQAKQRIGQLETEIALLNGRLDAIERVKVEPTVLPAPPAAEPPTVADPLARRVETMRRQVSGTRQMVDGFDGELEALEEDMDGHVDSIDALREEIHKLGIIVDNHADVIDAIGAQVDHVIVQLRPLQELNRVISVDGDNVVITDADLVLRQGKGDNGEYRGNGRVYTMVVPESPR